MIQLKSLLLEFDFNSDGELKKAKKIYDGLLYRGFSKTGAIGLIGNIAHESGCDPDISEVGGTGAYGLMQWDPGYKRKDALFAFAKHVGSSAANLNTQLNFMKCELINGYYWNGKPVPGIPKSLVYYKQKDGTYKGKSNYQVKKYNKSVIDGDIDSTTKLLMANVFSPIPGSLKKRINNSKKFQKYLDGDIDTINTSTDTYIVQAGDTLSSIAAKQPAGITAKTIADANGIDIKNPIKPGQKLKIK